MAPPQHCIWVPSGRLLSLTPLDRAFWIDRPVRTERVWAAVDEGRFIDRPIPPHSHMWRDPESHAERVAFFVEYGLCDEDFVEIDVGCPELGCYVNEPVQDGNHRLAGALLRGDPHIACSIGGGEEEIRRRFGGRIARQLFAWQMAA